MSYTIIKDIIYVLVVLVWVLSFIVNLMLMLIITLVIAALTLIERKFLALNQRRVGPYYVGYRGRLQYIADALKLFIKGVVIYDESNKFWFIAVPSFAGLICYFFWVNSVWCPSVSIVDIEYNLVYATLLSVSFGFCIILLGYFSGNKYTRLAAIRAALSMLNLELFLGLMVLTCVTVTESFCFSVFVLYQENYWLILMFFGLSGIICIIFLLEVGRTPFDLAEAESELVVGYSTEIGGFTFGIFYLGEYFHLFFFSAVVSILFFGGWELPNFITTFIFDYTIISETFWYLISVIDDRIVYITIKIANIIIDIDNALEDALEVIKREIINAVITTANDVINFIIFIDNIRLEIIQKITDIILYVDELCSQLVQVVINFIIFIDDMRLEIIQKITDIILYVDELCSQLVQVVINFIIFIDDMYSEIIQKITDIILYVDELCSQLVQLFIDFIIFILMPTWDILLEFTAAIIILYQLIDPLINQLVNYLNYILFVELANILLDICELAAQIVDANNTLILFLATQLYYLIEDAINDIIDCVLEIIKFYNFYKKFIDDIVVIQCGVDSTSSDITEKICDVIIRVDNAINDYVEYVINVVITFFTKLLNTKFIKMLYDFFLVLTYQIGIFFNKLILFAQPAIKLVWTILGHIDALIDWFILFAQPVIKPASNALDYFNAVCNYYADLLFNYLIEAVEESIYLIIDLVNDFTIIANEIIFWLFDSWFYWFDKLNSFCGDILFKIDIMLDIIIEKAIIILSEIDNKITDWLDYFETVLADFWNDPVLFILLFMDKVEQQLPVYILTLLYDTCNMLAFSLEPLDKIFNTNFSYFFNLLAESILEYLEDLLADQRMFADIHDMYVARLKENKQSSLIVEENSYFLSFYEYFYNKFLNFW